MPAEFPAPSFRAARVLTLLVLGLGLALGGDGGRTPAGAQVLAGPQVPAGRVRVDFAPSFQSWNSRFGITAGGNAEVESLGSDLADPTGTSLFPGILTLQENLRALLTDPGYQTTLGETRGTITKEISRIDAGLHVGVFDWLTVGVNVPWIRGRTAVDVAFRAGGDADLGLNPTITDGSAVSDVLTRLEDARVAAAAYAAGVCGGGSGEACSAATALADRASRFQSRAFGAYYSSPFFPTAGSAVGTSMAEALAALDADLAAAGLSGVGGLAFADEVLTQEDFASVSTAASAGIRGSALETVDGLWTMGDVELSASVRLLDGEVRDSGAAEARFAYALSGGGLVRLGTGTVDDPDVFLDIGSGDGQMDMEGRVDGFLQFGRRLDLRGGFRYGVQNSLTLTRRVAPHEEILVPIDNSRAVIWTPGSYTVIEVSPRYRLSPELSLALDYRRYHKGADTYEIFGDQAFFGPGVEVEDLSHETEMTAQEMGVGIRYSTVRSWRNRVATPPMEMGMRLVRTVAGTGGQTPKATRFEFSVSFFRRIWGGEPSPG